MHATAAIEVHERATAAAHEALKAHSAHVRSVVLLALWNSSGSAAQRAA
jgi:hypothetical protein